MKSFKYLIFGFFAFIFLVAAPQARAQYLLGVSPPEQTIIVLEGSKVQTRILIVRSEPEEEEIFESKYADPYWLSSPNGASFTLPADIADFEYTVDIDATNLSVGTYSHFFTFVPESLENSPLAAMSIVMGVSSTLNVKVVSASEFAELVKSTQIEVQGLDVSAESGLFSGSINGSFEVRNYQHNPISNIGYSVQLTDMDGEIVSNIDSGTIDLLGYGTVKVDFQASYVSEGDNQVRIVLSYGGEELTQASEDITIGPPGISVDFIIITLTALIAAVLAILFLIGYKIKARKRKGK
ncbi:MAG: hypothetical protein Q8P30_03325 [Candidatus Uhrbacteria bacterium]|nr:hypothetical protein [Candidatus Uhrbacteria bacterium]